MKPLSISYHGFDFHLEGKVILPASKSISNRVLIIKALCNEDFDLDHLSESTDTQILLDVLNSFKDTAVVQKLDVGDAGTCFRFLTAFFACKVGVEIILHGTDRMHHRPIGQLVDALNSLGADITYIENVGFPPLRIKGRKILGGCIKMNGDVSSQYISALCLIAPTLDYGLTIEIPGNLVSAPYVEMTLDLMANFGIEIGYRAGAIELKPQPYVACDFWVEADWSSVCFFYAMAMVCQSARIQCMGLRPVSVQGDFYISTFAKDFEIETIFKDGNLFIEKNKNERIVAGRTYDLSAYPDLAIPIIVACAIKYPQMKFSGLQHLIYKESNRILALQSELAKVGISLKYERDLLFFDNTSYLPEPKEISFETYNDHRVAMAFSLFALEGFTVVLNHADCVQKSFPNYFEQMASLGFAVGEM